MAVEFAAHKVTAEPPSTRNWRPLSWHLLMDEEAGPSPRPWPFPCPREGVVLAHVVDSSEGLDHRCVGSPNLLAFLCYPESTSKNRFLFV